MDERKNKVLILGIGNDIQQVFDSARVSPCQHCINVAHFHVEFVVGGWSYLDDAESFSEQSSQVSTHAEGFLVARDVFAVFNVHIPHFPDKLAVNVSACYDYWSEEVAFSAFVDAHMWL